MTNNVQTLDKKRGRPRSRLLGKLREKYPGLSSRQSINNKHYMLSIGTSAFRLGLVDKEFRDKDTGKRVETKMAIIGRLFGSDFFDTEQGKKWLSDNWPNVVSMTTVQIAEWAKTVRNNEP